MYVDTEFLNGEIHCPCGCGFYDINTELVARLLSVNLFYSLSGKIIAWCRCKDFDHKMWGLSEVSHLKGEAVHIQSSSPNYRFLLVQALMRGGFERIIIHKNYIHVDVSKMLVSPYLDYERG